MVAVESMYDISLVPPDLVRYQDLLYYQAVVVTLPSVVSASVGMQIPSPAFMAFHGTILVGAASPSVTGVAQQDFLSLLSCLQPYPAL